MRAWPSEVNSTTVAGRMPPNHWWLVIGAGLVVFMAQLDTLIVTIALPAIQADLHTRTSAAVGPIGGVLADRWGTRPTAVTGVGVLTVGLLLVLPLSEAWAPIGLAWRFAVIGVGLGLFIGPAQASAMSRVPRHLLGTTGASINVARQLGTGTGHETSRWCT